MGYYTSYTLKICGAAAEQSAALEKILLENGMEAWDKDAYCSWDMWYEHDEELLRLSELFPGLLFELYGQGEENADMWYSYYKDGKMQHCPATITFDPYDEAKLARPAKAR